MIVVDASVAFKWFKDEEGSEAARELLLEHGLSAPEIVIAEVLNAAWRAARIGAIEHEQLPAVARELPRCFSSLAPLVPLAARATEMARALDHPVYDCFYLALAERSDATLVTADGRLLARLQGTPWHAMTRALDELEA